VIIEADVKSGVYHHVNLLAEKLTISAQNDDNTTVMSEAGSGAILSGAGASTTFNNDTNVLAVLGDNTTIIVDAIDVWSNHNQKMDSKVDAKSFGLLAGTGGWIENTITGSANVDIGANTSVTANQLFLESIM
jgi:hypothetical protein